MLECFLHRFVSGAPPVCKQSEKFNQCSNLWPIYHWLATASGSQEWCFPMMIDVKLRGFCKPHLRWWSTRIWSDDDDDLIRWWWRSDEIRDVKNSAQVCIIRVLLENSPSIRLITRMILEQSRVLHIKTSTRYLVMTMITMISIVRLMRMIMMMTWWLWCSELMAGSRRPALGQRWLLTCYPRVINPHLASALFFSF